MTHGAKSDSDWRFGVVAKTLAQGLSGPDGQAPGAWDLNAGRVRWLLHGDVRPLSGSVMPRVQPL